MALSFNFSRVENNERVITNPRNDDEWHPVADALIWLSMICGFDSINNVNQNDVADRVLAYQHVVGPYLRIIKDGKPEPVWITRKDVLRFTGMTTNANRMTRAQWQRRLGDIAMASSADAERKRNKEGAMPMALDIIGYAKEKTDATSA